VELEGKFDEARKFYEESIAYHATLDGYRRLSSLFLNQGKETLAAEVFERALALRDLKPEVSFELHLATGNCLSRAKLYPAAEKHYGKALSIKPSSGEAHQNLGSLYLAQGRIQESRAQYQAALQANPRNDAALQGLASCALAEGRKREAHDLFAQALDVRLDNPHAIYHLVKCAYELRSYATAARLTEDYVQIAPVNPNLMYSLAGLQYHLGRLEDAGRTLQQILTMQPTHAGAKDLLARLSRPEAGLE
jgi:tetratricopeptide (TPR) repeat protein